MIDPLEYALDVRNRGAGTIGLTGATGPQGPAGPQGLPGVDGVDGTDGVGVPAGGTAGQVLAKVDGTDYNTTWVNKTGGGGGSVGLAAGIEIYVLNLTGNTIYKGQPVYINGSNGNNITIALAKADTDATSSKTIGLVKEDISPSSHGYVISEGVLEGLNTSGTTAGDPIWLSPTTAGGVLYGLANKPVAPDHMVYLGVVERVQSINGSIYVKVQNGFEIEELHNVKITNVLDGQVIKYDGTAGIWVNANDNTGSGGGASIARNTVTVTTTSLADNATFTGTISLAKTYTLLKITTNIPARVRIYDTVANRSADLSRPVGTPHAENSGLILEYVTTLGILSATLSPLVDGTSLETTPTSNIPISITNLSGSTDTVTVTFTYIPLEV